MDNWAIFLLLCSLCFARSPSNKKSVVNKNIKPNLKDPSRLDLGSGKKVGHFVSWLKAISSCTTNLSPAIDFAMVFEVNSVSVLNKWVWYQNLENGRRKACVLQRWIMPCYVILLPILCFCPYCVFCHVTMCPGINEMKLPFYPLETKHCHVVFGLIL